LDSQEIQVDKTSAERARTHTHALLQRRATERQTSTYFYRTSKNTSITLSVNTHIRNISITYDPLKLDTIRKKKTFFSDEKK